MTFIFRNRTIFWDISKWNRGQKKMRQREYIRLLMFIQMRFFFFFKEFHPIMSASDDSSLSTNQDTNQIFGVSRD